MLVPSPAYGCSVNTDSDVNSDFLNSDSPGLDRDDDIWASLFGCQHRRQTTVVPLSSVVLQLDEISFFLYRDLSVHLVKVPHVSRLGFRISLCRFRW